MSSGPVLHFYKIPSKSYRGEMKSISKTKQREISPKVRKPELSFLYLTWHLVLFYISTKYHNKKSAEGIIAPAGAKVTGATIRMWLLNKFISFLAVLTWKTGLKKM